MNPSLLAEARRIARTISHCIQLRVPSVLAAGETFGLRISVTGPDALPAPAHPCWLRFENCVGVEGLPERFRFEEGQTAARIEGLVATGPDAMLIRAKVEDSGHALATPEISANPAWVFDDPPYRLFWGDLHVHTEFSNCSGWRCLHPEWCYAYARDVSLLDFAAPADHLRGIAWDEARWPVLQEQARTWNEPGRFATFLAFESSHAQGYGGDNNAYFLDDDAPHFWVDREDMRGTSPKVHLKDLWRQLDESGKAYFTAPHHTGRAQKYRSWDEDYYDPEREPLFEIYSSWGSSEKRHTTLPIYGGNNDGPSYFADALKAGARFGVFASSDDHATLPGSVHYFRINPFAVPRLGGFPHKGLAAVRAPELTRGALFEAMRRRDTYATTHTKTLIDMRLGDAAMGEEIQADDALSRKREVRARVSLDGAGGGAAVLVRNGEDIASLPLGREPVSEVVFEDSDRLDRVAVRDAKFHPRPFVAYYVRIENRNNARQWTSPIWIDLE